MLNLKGKTLGRYHLVEPLGEGGMAVVYRAYDASLDRSVAIKVIRAEIGVDPTFLQRFQREAKALAYLDHPYILKVLDYGEQDGLPYLVMPFVTGGTLKQKLNGIWPPADAARLLVPVARALAYAHQLGIIHRDVKPANILLSPSGAPLLSDFGIAKIIQGEGSSQLTATGVGMGTPDYMAPEQWLGTTDARTDVYALGVVFYEMVTGRLPYIADTPAAVLLKHMQDPLPRPSDLVPGLPGRVEQILFKALAKDPEARFQDMGAFAEALEQLVTNGAPPAPAETPPAPEPPKAQASAAPSRPVPLRAAAAQPQPAPVTAQPKPAAAPAAHPAAPRTGQNTPLPARSAPGVPPAAAGRLQPQPEAAVQLGAAVPAARPARKLLPWLGIVGGIAAGLVILCLIGAALILAYQYRQSAQTRGIPTARVVQPTLEPVMLETLAPPMKAATRPPMNPEGSQAPPITRIEGLPSDLPILPQNNGDLQESQLNGMNVFMYTTPLTMQEAGAFFDQEMYRLGWTVSGTTTATAPFPAIMVGYMKGSRIVFITIGLPQGITTVQVAVQQN